MTLATYAGLQAEVLSAVFKTTSDTGLAAAIPGHIQMIEGYLNRNLRCNRMVGRDTATITDEYSATPTDFLGPIAFRFTDSTPLTSLEWVSPTAMADLKATWLQTSNRPTCYTVVGSEFEYGPVPAGSYSAALTYYKSITALSVGVNWVLTSYPDIYYHGCLSYAWRYLRDDKAADLEYKLFLQAIQEAEAADKAETIGGQLRVMADFAP